MKVHKDDDHFWVWILLIFVLMGIVAYLAIK